MSTPTLPLNAAGLPVDMTTVDVTYGTRTLQSVAPLQPQTSLGQLTEHELEVLRRLSLSLVSDRWRLELRNAYYLGEQQVRDLGISIPPQMRNLRTVIGWPRVAVESLEERINLDGFRYAGTDDNDQDLQDIWTANDMDSEGHLARLDALVFGRGFMAAGSPDETGGAPVITVESPLDMGLEWDPRRRRTTAALRLYGAGLTKLATLYLPDQTISLTMGINGWVVEDRDMHGLGVVPVVRIANRARSYDRLGTSDITPEIMSLTDGACRTLQGLEVAREFFSAPQRYILGATEESFQAPDGTPKSGWETYIGRILALERDEDGNVPTVGQFTAYDPSAFTKVIDMYARVMSAVTGLPPHDLGFTTDNPASADAIRSGDMRITRKAQRKCADMTAPHRELMSLAVAIRDGKAPDSTSKPIVPVWASCETPTIGQTTDAIVKQVTVGLLPAASDVALERLGYNAEERERIAAERLVDQGASALAALTHSLAAKDLRTATTIAADEARAKAGTLGAAPGAPTPTPTPAPASAKPGS